MLPDLTFYFVLFMKSPIKYPQIFFLFSGMTVRIRIVSIMLDLEGSRSEGPKRQHLSRQRLLCQQRLQCQQLQMIFAQAKQPTLRSTCSILLAMDGKETGYFLPRMVSLRLMTRRLSNQSSPLSTSIPCTQ